MCIRDSHCDVGFYYLGLASDIQQNAYVLKFGEDSPPLGLVRALATGNKMQDIVMGQMQAPVSYTHLDVYKRQLQVLAVMCRSGKEMSELASILKMSPQRLVNVELSSRPPLESLPTVQAAIAAAEKELGQEGRVLVRYSGTQNLCRVMAEGPTDEMVGRLCESIADALRKAVG